MCPPVTLVRNTMVSSGKTKVRDGIARLNYRQGTPTSDASDTEPGTGGAEAENLIVKAIHQSHPSETYAIRMKVLGGESFLARRFPDEEGSRARKVFPLLSKLLLVSEGGDFLELTII